jgi:hypothetical protein
MKPYEPFDPNKAAYELDLDDELDDDIDSDDVDSDDIDVPSESDKNEGEGSRTAARRYQDKLKAFIDEGKVGSAARDAARAVDSDEGPSLRAAEEEGKSRARMSKVDQVKSIARAFISGAKAAYHEAKRK